MSAKKRSKPKAKKAVRSDKRVPKKDDAVDGLQEDSGVMNVIGKYLPFLKTKPARSKIERETVLKKRAKVAKKRARRRAQKYRERVHHPVARVLRTAALSITPDIPAQKPLPLSLEMPPVTAEKPEKKEPEKQEAAAPAPAAEVVDDFSERLFVDVPKTKRVVSNGPLSIGPVKQKKEEEPQAPIKQEAIGDGIGGFFKSFFTTPLFSRAKPDTSEVPMAAFAGSAPAKPKVAPADLDALFQSEPAKKEAPKAEVPLKKQVKTVEAEVKPELPDAEFMQPAVISSDTTARKEAPPEQAPAKKQKAEKAIALEPVPPPKEAAKKQELPEAAAKMMAQSVEIVYKPRPVRRGGAIAEFFGSVRYFGLGKFQHEIIQNLAMMLNAGLPLIDSLRTLELETRVRPVKKLLRRILDLVENGSPLWRALEDQHFFTPHAIALIRIGEEAGNLAENMEYLSVQQEKDAALRGKVKMAMIYPSIVMSMMFIVVIGLGMFVLPNLISVLFSLNVELPLVTRMVIAFTNFFVEYGKTAVPAFIVGFILLGILCKFTPLKIVAQWVMFRIPGIGRLVTEATIGRFGVILGGLLQAGVPLVDALRSLAEVTPVVAYKKLYERMLDHIMVGDSFSKSFQILRGSEKLLPVSVQQLIITGEKSGSLAKILLKISDIYEKKANATAEKLPVILEPMILLIIGALVGTIAFAIIVPIYSIVGNVGG